MNGGQTKPNHLICGRYDPTLPAQPNNNPPKERIIRERAGGSQAQDQRRAIAKIYGWKSPLDNIFLADPHLDWTETFQFEVRNTTLISVDIVSAYPHVILTEPWLDPAKLRLYQGDLSPQIQSREIPAGIFLCHLTRKNTAAGKWIQTHHPLRYTRGGKSHHFLWTGDSTIQTLLMAQDIRALDPFCHIQTEWGIMGPTIKQHPLTNKIRELLEQKLSGNKTAKLPLVKACSTQRGRRILPTKEAIQWHENSFGEAYNDTHHKNIKHLIGGETEILGPSNKTAHCLFSPVRAAVRAKMLGLAWELENLGGELARIHTDGLTITCPDPETTQKVLNALQPRLGQQAGQLKITRSNYGFFLGPNLWWTFQVEPPEIALTDLAGPNSKDPFNPYIDLPGSKGQVYNLHGQTETTKILRRQNGDWRWHRTDPAHQPNSRERRKTLRNYKLAKWRRFQRDLAEIQTQSTQKPNQN